MKFLPRRESPRRKIWIRRYTLGGVALASLIVISLVAAPAKRIYNNWKMERALAQAEAFLAAQDFPNTKMALDVALAAKPGNPEALRVAADLLEQVGAPEVMPLRRRLVEAEPDAAENHAALVMSALRFNDLNAARDAMRAMTPEQANTPAALRAALAYAQSTSNLPIADLLYQRLREEEPDNQNLQVLHAVLRLNSPTGEIRETALSELETLSQQPRHTLYILRHLLIDAMGRQETERANLLAHELGTAPGATLTDQLHRANLNLNVNKQAFDDVLAEVMPYVKPNATDATELLRWLVLVGEADRAASWLAQQTEEILSAPQVRNVRSEIAIAQLAWDQLAELIEAGAWGPIQRDTVRLAFSAQLAADRGNEHLREQIWKEALASASTSLPDLTTLYRLAALWRWEKAAEDSLWAVTRAFPNRTWAHQTLFNNYRLRRDTEKMQALIGSLRLADSTLPRYRYDWSLLSMLLRRQSSWTNEKQTMQALFESDPTNSYYITGYAFALSLSDRPDEAIELLQNLSAAEQALPERAPYLAFVYAHAYQSHKVDELLAGAEQFTKFLPEETELLQAAREYVR